MLSSCLLKMYYVLDITSNKNYFCIQGFKNDSGVISTYKTVLMKNLHNKIRCKLPNFLLVLLLAAVDAIIIICTRILNYLFPPCLCSHSCQVYLIFLLLTPYFKFLKISTLNCPNPYNDHYRNSSHACSYYYHLRAE